MSARRPKQMHRCALPVTAETVVDGVWVYVRCHCGFMYRCANCERELYHHAGGKCLFAAGDFTEKNPLDYWIVGNNS